MNATKKHRQLLTAACLAVAALPAAAQTADPRAEFMRQLQPLLLSSSPAAAQTADSEALRQYVLYPYLEAQRLRAPMRQGLAPDDAAVAALLLRDGDAPWTRELRRDWLLDLARRQNWPLFRIHYLEPRADARLRCENLNAALATTTPGAPSTTELDLISVWMTGSQLPENCVAPFEQARVRGWLTPDRLERRARLALEAGKLDIADFQLRLLPAEAAPALRTWARLLRNPDTELDALLAHGAAAFSVQEPAALLAGFSKLAKRDPGAAASRLRAIETLCLGAACGLTAPASLDDLRRELGLGYALSRLPEAVAAFRAVSDPASLNDQGHEWRVRAALWAGDWPLAQQWIAQMPPALAQQSRWRYWQARALAQAGESAAAQSLYEGLLGDNNYYALLASARLKRAFAPVPKPSPNDPALQQLLLQKGGVIRARELWLAQRSDWSAVEWTEVLSTLDAPQLVQAARLPQGWGAPLQSVVAASKAQVFDDFELLYPRPFEAEVRDAAALSRVSAERIYAIMRQESLYDPRARSGANALGLLQLLPGTARDVARRNALPSPSNDDLFDPRINIKLGAVHLRELLDLYGGEFALVFGAYNAGPRPVQRWRPSAPMDLDVWIENVPYNETRSYIQRVFWHGAVFAWRASGKPQRHDEAMLRVVTPGNP